MDIWLKVSNLIHIHQHHNDCKTKKIEFQLQDNHLSKTVMNLLYFQPNREGKKSLQVKLMLGIRNWHSFSEDCSEFSGGKC